MCAEVFKVTFESKSYELYWYGVEGSIQSIFQ